MPKLIYDIILIELLPHSQKSNLPVAILIILIPLTDDIRQAVQPPAPDALSVVVKMTWCFGHVPASRSHFNTMARRESRILRGWELQVDLSFAILDSLVVLPSGLLRAYLSSVETNMVPICATLGVIVKYAPRKTKFNFISVVLLWSV